MSNRNKPGDALDIVKMAECRSAIMVAQKAGVDVADAIQKAQRAYRDMNNVDPDFWAQFEVFAETDLIVLSLERKAARRFRESN